MSGTTVASCFNYNSYTSYQTSSKKMDEVSFSDSIDVTSDKVKKQEPQRGSVMEEYYAKKPQYKERAKERVEGGCVVLKCAGISAEDIEGMSMSEFKDVMSKVIAGIPHHATRPYDEETVLISEEGWESMKKDPDYAAYVVGLLQEDRSFANPFFAMGDKGSYVVQHFGASPEDYHGVGFSKIYGGTAAGARSMYNSAKSAGGIETRGPQADLQPPADYNLWEERRKAKRRKRKEQLDEEIMDQYYQKKRIDGMYEIKLFENKELERSRGAAEMIGSQNNTSHAPKLSMASGMAFYEAAFMTSDIAEMF